MFDEVIRNGQIRCNADIDIRQAPDNLPFLLKSKDALASSRSSIYQGVYRNGSRWNVSYEIIINIIRYFDARKVNNQESIITRQHES
jgi:hypothetical protein